MKLDEIALNACEVSTNVLKKQIEDYATFIVHRHLYLVSEELSDIKFDRERIYNLPIEQY